MLRFARRRTDPQTAEDVVSEALLVLWRRLDEMPADEVTAWAIGVTRWCLANADRTARRQRGLLARMARLAPVADTGHDDRDGDATLYDALATLSEQDRELLRLWAWDDLRPAEMAIVLGIRAENVSVRLHRAKRRLASALSQAAGGTGPDKPRDAPTTSEKRTK